MISMAATLLGGSRLGALALPTPVAGKLAMCPRTLPQLPGRCATKDDENRLSTQCSLRTLVRDGRVDLALEVTHRGHLAAHWAGGMRPERTAKAASLAGYTSTRDVAQDASPRFHRGVRRTTTCRQLIGVPDQVVSSARHLTLDLPHP